MTDTAPSGALTWGSAAERNKRLKLWRRAVSMTFAVQPRCLRVAWALDHLFNAKTGFCNASNPYLANETGLPVNKVQEALCTLESGGAIVRVVTLAPGRQRWRAIYPATALLPSLGSPPPRGVTGSPPLIGVTGHPHLLGVQNLSKRTPPQDRTRPRPTRGQYSAGTGGLGAWHGRRLSEQRSDRRWQGHTLDRGGCGRDRIGPNHCGGQL